MKTSKDKADELVNNFGNKKNALMAVNEAINNYESTSMFYCSKVKVLPKIFWLEVKQELENK
ncbi:hypothetical protein UFOVP1384_42 [uncultured Caudovirales phage]|uniref:Uncharacterized protein n=1 Tax=uncultured Caudovirales phage TaxID=2100421 RepID=A0A6J5S725_9CAUD|nr:hypothetical protein UFOVP1384_42 [uncultured Caudovirales phage]